MEEKRADEFHEISGRVDAIGRSEIPVLARMR
jgi:hypothetical protein